MAGEMWLAGSSGVAGEELISPKSDYFSEMCVALACDFSRATFDSTNLAPQVLLPKQTPTVTQ